MVTIVIKSFNRPYYLDRCLQSIQICVEGNFEIKVLDDGTPKVYLDKLIKKYPNILLLKSKQYLEKVNAINKNLTTGEAINGFKIPTDLWYNTVKNSSDYVLVIEDDVWFTQQVNLDELVKQMQQYNIALLKLGWLGNEKDDLHCNVNNLSNEIKAAIPKKLFTSNKWVMDLFMYNKYKFFTILYKLGLVDNQTKRKYWTINSILMGLYQKDYWLSIWADANGNVDEKQQLRNAATWYHKNKNAVFAKTTHEILKTTFQSSATGSYHAYDNWFDVNRMNFILNEFWLNDAFDVMENYPKDFSDGCIKRYLNQINHPNAKAEEWFKWAEKFKNQYRNLGAEVDN